MEPNKDIIFPQTTSSGVKPNQAGKGETYQIYTEDELRTAEIQSLSEMIVKTLRSPSNKGVSITQDYREKIWGDMCLLLYPERQLLPLLEKWYDDITLELKKIPGYTELLSYSLEKLAHMAAYWAYNKGENYPELKVEAVLEMDKRVNEYWLGYYWLELLQWIKVNISEIERRGTSRAMIRLSHLYPQLDRLLNVSEDEEELFSNDDHDTIDEISGSGVLNFQSLFRNSDRIEACVDYLRRVRNPVIDEQGNWIKGGSGKSTIVVWIEVLEQRGEIRAIDKKSLCKLLKAYFPGLSISDSIFRRRTNIQSELENEFLAMSRR